LQGNKTLFVGFLLFVCFKYREIEFLIILLLTGKSGYAEVLGCAELPIEES
jgi:hypothetical protein